MYKRSLVWYVSLVLDARKRIYPSNAAEWCGQGRTRSYLNMINDRFPFCVSKSSLLDQLFMGLWTAGMNSHACQGSQSPDFLACEQGDWKHHLEIGLLVLALWNCPKYERHKHETTKRKNNPPPSSLLPPPSSSSCSDENYFIFSPHLVFWTEIL